MLKDYQKNRIQTVFRPVQRSAPCGLSDDPIKDRSRIRQVPRQGISAGISRQLGFLPARHTDFVFASWAEERGFAGSVAVLGLFILVALRLLRAAREAKDKVGTLICAGVLSLYWFHVTINVGMALGLLPIAGIPCLSSPPVAPPSFPHLREWDMHEYQDAPIY